MSVSATIVRRIFRLVRVDSYDFSTEDKGGVAPFFFCFLPSLNTCVQRSATLSSRGSEVQRFSSDILYVRTYVSPQTCVRTRTDLPFECAQQWAQTSRPSASASALPSFPVVVLRVCSFFIFIFNFIHLGLVCLLGCAGCFAMKSEV